MLSFLCQTPELNFRPNTRGKDCQSQLGISDRKGLDNNGLDDKGLDNKGLGDKGLDDNYQGVE